MSGEYTHIKGYVVSKLENIDLNAPLTTPPGSDVDCVVMELNKVKKLFEKIPFEQQTWDLSPAIQGTSPVLVAGLYYVEGEPEPELPLKLTESFDPETPPVKLRYVVSEQENVDLNAPATTPPGSDVDRIAMLLDKIGDQFETIPFQQRTWDIRPAIQGTSPVIVTGLCYVEGEPEPELPSNLTESFDPETPFVKLRLWAQPE
ncbi:hypothetical protein H0H81_002756 [Sphagnurus paluster]|uniref:Uncharacterized protein n=1 Tax=Sphagnurus paluster TaxID=117069 RepID=A0A9P7GMV0_9AGAR|nr:hypothetical protein H0H81_002756 [Sphagnurus paluster]